MLRQIRNLDVTILCTIITVGAARVFCEAIPKMAEDGHLALSLTFSAVAAVLFVGGLLVYTKIIRH